MYRGRMAEKQIPFRNQCKYAMKYERKNSIRGETMPLYNERRNIIEQKPMCRGRTAEKQIFLQESMKICFLHEGKNGMQSETKPYLVKKEKRKNRTKKKHFAMTW